jgi:Flp pilus assembly pilin Flp
MEQVIRKVEKERKMKNMLKRFVQDEQGLELSEYAVMAALIVAALVSIIVLLRGAISNKFQALTTAIQSQS